MKDRVLRKASSGQSFIEFAIVLPLLLLLGLGVFEFGRAIQAKNIITNMSREGANLASRSTTTPQDIMNALAATAQPLNMSSYGMMYITQVNGKTDGSGNVEVAVQYRWPATKSSPASKVWGGCTSWGSDGTCTSLHTPLPLASLTALHLQQHDLADGQVAYAAEVFYNYQVIFKKIIKYSPQLYSETVL